MNVFEAVKATVMARQAAEMYGISVSKRGMALCPFHPDRNPSLKLDARFHCFGCHADGDVIDFVSRLFHLSAKEAAEKLADDFEIALGGEALPHIREPTPEQIYKEDEVRTCQILSEYFHFLLRWRHQFAPQRPGDDWHPLFVEALQKLDSTEYQLDILRYGTEEERRELTAFLKTEVKNIEQRIAQWSEGGRSHGGGSEAGTGTELPG